jgi:hypothetical protein
MSDDYRHFCRDVASRHLSRFSEIHPDVEVTTSADTLLPGIHPLEELAAVVGEVDASRVMERVKKHLPQKGTPELSDFRRVLFFEIHNRGAAKKYSGLDEFAALSSGNIRTFMRLCEGAFDLAFERTAIGAYKAIAPDVQDIAARQVAREWLTSRIPTTTSVYEGEVRHLVESFARMLKERYTRGPQECVWRRLRVTPKDNMPVSLSADVQESVRSAVQAGILKSIPSPADAFVFEVAPVFAPEWDLSFELAGTLDVQPAALEHMMTLFLKN